MALDDQLRGGTLNEAQFAELESRVAALEQNAQGDGAAVPSIFNIDNEGEVTNVENVAVNELVSEEGDIIIGGAGGKAKTLHKGKKGQVLKVGPTGELEWAEEGGGPEYAAVGTYVVNKIEWAKGAGNTFLVVHDALQPTWQPTHLMAFAYSDGTNSNSAALGKATYAGVTLVNSLFSSQSTARPAVAVKWLGSGTSGGAPLPLFPNASQRFWVFERSAATAESNKTVIYMAYFSFRNMPTGGAALTLKEETAGGKLILTTYKNAPDIRLVPAAYSRDTESLPSGRSGVSIVEAKAERSAAGIGTVGLQLHIPSEAERAAEGNVEPFWQFPNHVAEAAQRAAEGQAWYL